MARNPGRYMSIENGPIVDRRPRMRIKIKRSPLVKVVDVKSLKIVSRLPDKTNPETKNAQFNRKDSPPVK